MEPVVMDAGYESLSGFREAFPQTFENSPGGNRSPDCIVAWKVRWVRLSRVLTPRGCAC